jgi:N-acetylneuraminate synthase
MKMINWRNPLSGPTYFIADIAANHDGSLDRAKKLIQLAAESGADAAKFQNFKAETIVSGRGFRELGQKLTHQAKWKKSVFEVYQDAELPIEWTDELIGTCKEFEIDYFTAPYDLDFVDYFAEKMPFFKIGSGDITWSTSIRRMAEKNIPILLATGASTMEEVNDAMDILGEYDVPVVLMQCNTNYTGEIDNFNYLNLNVLSAFSTRYPHAVLGLSDHSPGHVAVLGAVALGARVVEKHFTDDTSRVGPDHGFSLDPAAWRNMVEDTRLLERALGDGIKKVEDNEIQSRIVQRRALRFATNLPQGHKLSTVDLVALRPIPENGISPFDLLKYIGRTLNQNVEFDQLLTHELLESD